MKRNHLFKIICSFVNGFSLCHNGYLKTFSDIVFFTLPDKCLDGMLKVFFHFCLPMFLLYPNPFLKSTALKYLKLRIASLSPFAKNKSNTFLCLPILFRSSFSS